MAPPPNQPPKQSKKLLRRLLRRQVQRPFTSQHGSCQVTSCTNIHRIEIKFPYFFTFKAENQTIYVFMLVCGFALRSGGACSMPLQ